jgi:hypothetical protein
MMKLKCQCGAYVEFSDPWGLFVCRRRSKGRRYGVTLEQAQADAWRARHARCGRIS